MKIGYARTSTIGQQAELEAQTRILETASVDKIFTEQLSSRETEHPQLTVAIDFARKIRRSAAPRRRGPQRRQDRR